MKRSSERQGVGQQQLAIVDDTTGQTRELVGQQLERATLAMISALYEQEVERLCGVEFSRKAEGDCHRGGWDPSTARVGGQRMSVRKPRVRRAGREVELETHRALRQYDLLNERIMNHMLTGVSTRNYDRLLEEMEGGLGLKKSTVSKAFVRGSKQQLEAINGRSLKDYRWCAVMIDGIEFSGRHVIVALGITTAGKKVVLGLREGSTENSEVVKDLLQNLIDRGLDKELPFLFVLDGGKALKKAVRLVFGDLFPVQRCVRHKERNVLEYLPKNLHGEFRRRWKLIHGMTSYADAKQEYVRLSGWLKNSSQPALESLLEADEETMTILRLRCPATLRKTLLSTNPIESAFNGVRSRTNRVKNWRPGSDQIARWSAATLLDVEARFNCIQGHREIPLLLAEINKTQLHQQGQVA